LIEILSDGLVGLGEFFYLGCYFFYAQFFVIAEKDVSKRKAGKIKARKGTVISDFPAIRVRLQLKQSYLLGEVLSKNFHFPNSVLL
jgi:hypothetical protein